MSLRLTTLDEKMRHPSSSGHPSRAIVTFPAVEAAACQRSRNTVAVLTPHLRLTRVACGTTFCRTPEGEGRRAVSLLICDAVVAVLTDRVAKLNSTSPGNSQEGKFCLQAGIIFQSRRLVMYFHLC